MVVSRLSGEFARLLDTLSRRPEAIGAAVEVTPQTHRLIGARQLALMKPSAVLVNVARGENVDQTALTEALRERRIAAAGLDVFEAEPLPADDPLLALDNV